ncbi:V-type proton ATPase subunit H-like [Tropilaelaps mercedesae]|uniref:V-type proton ATPase subunit H-like n=1 Tax=Tropilaelaps mercedesae TaxID=418985 RepID=A0A1V9XFF1_9ACAR|nr:V-type proton ATPase subunit H-like [Tropilaelaps mercedesae]
MGSQVLQEFMETAQTYRRLSLVHRRTSIVDEFVKDQRMASIRGYEILSSSTLKFVRISPNESKSQSESSGGFVHLRALGAATP